MPLAPTPLQSEASRRNGSRSHGPASEAGKAVAARNATKHGLRGGGISVRPEESDWYAGLLASHLELYAPANGTERGLVEQLCVLELKLARLDLLELAALEAAAEASVEGHRPLSTLATLTRYRSRITKERWELEHRLGQLRHHRKALGADAAAARNVLRDRARARALGSIAMTGLLGSAMPTGDSAGGTNEPDAVRADPQNGTNEPELGAGAACGTSEPDAGARPLNRRQRRIMEKLARRNAARAALASAA